MRTVLLRTFSLATFIFLGILFLTPGGTWLAMAPAHNTIMLCVIIAFAAAIVDTVIRGPNTPRGGDPK